MSPKLPDYPSDIPFKFSNLQIGPIVSALLPTVFVLAGILLLIMLILGGLQLMVSAGDPKAADQARGKITGAIMGFVIIFISYWLILILQAIFGLPKIFEV